MLAAIRNGIVYSLHVTMLENITLAKEAGLREMGANEQQVTEYISAAINVAAAGFEYLRDHRPVIMNRHMRRTRLRVEERARRGYPR